uniref:Malic enzyme n=1 Tax=Monodelphis domestica TaxID=13616 RepID=A0A5F8HHV3_MONDO
MTQRFLVAAGGRAEDTDPARPGGAPPGASSPISVPAPSTIGPSPPRRRRLLPQEPQQSPHSSPLFSSSPSLQHLPKQPPSAPPPRSQSRRSVPPQRPRGLSETAEAGSIQTARARLSRPAAMEAAVPSRYTQKRGYDVTRSPHLNKGMAFTLEERQQLNIHGLLPPCFLDQDVQVLRVVKNFERLNSDFDRGLFISIHDRGHIATLLKSWPEDVVKAVVVTDGERILGLGDLGCNGMGIPVGKLALYTACGGMNPEECLPVTLDVGTENEELLKDPLYIGLRHKRVRGGDYDDFLDEFMEAVTSRYGMNCLIQFEDFANANAFRLLEKYRNKFCTFNDDIQGTASVAVAGLLAALRITQNKLSDHTVLFQGAGEAALGIANLIVMALKKEGISNEEAIKKIWMVDSKGLIVKGRSFLTHEKERFAHEHHEMKNLEEIVRDIKPTVLIGVAAVGGAFTEQILKDMASLNERPIIFALSNPTSKAECTAEQCYLMTEGRGIFASGSPFNPVTLPDGRTFYPGQGNNSYVFPGVALGVVACGLRHIPEKIFLTTAEVIAQEVSNKHLEEGRLYPPLKNIQEVSFKIAVQIVEEAYRDNSATVYPEPQDKKEFIRSKLYRTEYEKILPDCYSWPKEAMKIQPAIQN